MSYLSWSLRKKGRFYLNNFFSELLKFWVNQYIYNKKILLWEM